MQYAKKYAPASPKKIFPKRFKTKKPINAPRRTFVKYLYSIESSIFIPEIYSINFKASIIETRYEESWPFIPSIKLKAFIIPTIAKHKKARDKISISRKLSKLPNPKSVTLY